MGKKLIVIDTVATDLPVGEVLDWQLYQKFCTDILFNKLNITHSREYLAQGSRQDGIDIYAAEGINEKLITAQCKLEKYLSPKDITGIIDLFIAGEFAAKTKEFILCTTFDLSKHRNDELTIASAKQKLDQIGVEFVLWDKNGLSTELRNHPVPDVVYRYFGQEVASAFYGTVFTDWLKRSRKIEKLSYVVNTDHIERHLTTYSDYRERLSNAYSYYYESKYLKLTDLIDNSITFKINKFLILSIAGFGKTFELDYIAGYYANQAQYIFPIKCYLSDYEGQPINHLLDLFCPGWEGIGDNGLLLIFDGLDEIREVHFLSFINHVNLFCGARPQINVVISTRFNFYDLVNLPLRDFETLILHPFNNKDTGDYLNKMIPDLKDQFLTQVEKHHFIEFMTNPYYLSRLVRFFKSSPADFPVSKVALFERILFEKFDRDNRKITNPLTKPEFLRMAQKIAYCMTVLGKSSLSGEQMETILSNKNSLKLIQRFFLLNKSANAINDWSFEHKNLQEYLCASFLQILPIEKILAITTYPYDRNKLQTKFINTFSFLFVIINKETPLFVALLRWLTEYQQEILIRFEKERIPRVLRIEISWKIITYYQDKNHSLYSSSGFSIKELADFVEVDEEIINQVGSRIDMDKTDWMAFNGVDLIANCNKAYIYEEAIKAVFFKVLNNTAFNNHTKANCIEAFNRLGINDRSTFAAILASPINLEDTDTRHFLIQFLHSSDFAEDYLDLLISSLPVFEQIENNMSRLGSSEFLKKLILRSVSPASHKKILQYVLQNKEVLAFEDTGDGKITAEEFSFLLNKGIDLFAADKRVLPLVYKFYINNPAITLDPDWLQPVLAFFRATCGLPAIFKKSYQYFTDDRRIMELAGEPECEFLIQEYKSNRFAKQQMVIFRNILSHCNHPLFEYFYNRLNQEFDNEFFIADKDFDYAAHWKSYQLKNQQMLMDRSLFFDEIREIFNVLDLDTVTKKDFHNYTDYRLHKFQQSVALRKLRLDADKTPRTMDDFIRNLSNDDKWEFYKMHEINQLLNKRKQTKDLPIEPALLTYASDWCREHVIKLDYLNSVQNNSQGAVTFTHEVEFTNELFMKLDINLEDDLLIKMLASDFRGGMNQNELGISALIIAKIKDKSRLKTAVLDYLKLDLALYVQKTLYAICEKMGYKECMPLLYKFITTHKGLYGHDQPFLCDIYITLGGQVQDFKKFVRLPLLTEEVSYLSWNWYLIEKFLTIDPEFSITYLLPVLSDPQQPESHKILAAEYLIRVNRIEGLIYWSEYILINHKTPFDNRRDFLTAHVNKMPLKPTIDILLKTMEPFIVTEAEAGNSRRNFITDAVIDLLRTIVSNAAEAFAIISAGLTEFLLKYKTVKTDYWLNRYLDEIRQDYNSHLNQERSIEEIAEEFDRAMGS
jgi:hypothetical protein